VPDYVGQHYCLPMLKGHVMTIFILLLSRSLLLNLLVTKTQLRGYTWEDFSGKPANAIRILVIVFILVSSTWTALCLKSCRSLLLHFPMGALPLDSDDIIWQFLPPIWLLWSFSDLVLDISGRTIQVKLHWPWCCYFDADTHNKSEISQAR
jgi:hypothetical protein